MENMVSFLLRLCFSNRPLILIVDINSHIIAMGFSFVLLYTNSYILYAPSSSIIFLDPSSYVIGAAG